MPTVTRPVPPAAREAVDQVVDAYTHGGDAQYAEALQRLQHVSTQLDEGGRDALNALLAHTAAGVRERELLSTVTRALRHGAASSVRVIGEDLEVLQVHAPGLEQLLIVVPAYRREDRPRARRKITAARQAALNGHCPRCGADLEVVTGQQLALVHADGCPLHERALAGARARNR